MKPFIEWYYEYATVMKYLSSSELNVLDDLQKSWTTTDGQTIKSVHPPHLSAELAPGINYSSQPLHITAFVKPPDGFEKCDIIWVKDLAQIMKQNNYTNLHLQTVQKTNQKKPALGLIHPVNIKPPLEVSNFKLRLVKQDNEFLDNYQQSLDEDEDGELSPSHILEIHNNFQDIQHVNKTYFPKQMAQMALIGLRRIFYMKKTFFIPKKPTMVRPFMNGILMDIQNTKSLKPSTRL
ncbi:hypothetical protein ACSBR1_001244 [Camellia fascicularis]